MYREIASGVIIWLVLVLPGIAHAQNKVGLNGAACAYTTLSSAVAAAVVGDTLYVKSGTTLADGNFTISIDVHIYTGTSTCGVPGAYTHADIDGSGNTVDGITIASGHTVDFNHIQVTDHNRNNFIVDGTLILNNVGVQHSSDSNVYISSSGTVEMNASGGSNSTLINSVNAFNGGGAPWKGASS